MSSIDELGASMLTDKLTPSKSAQSQAWRLAWEEAYLKAGGGEERPSELPDGRLVTGTDTEVNARRGQTLSNPPADLPMKPPPDDGQPVLKPGDRAGAGKEDLTVAIRRLWSLPAGIRAGVTVDQAHFYSWHGSARRLHRGAQSARAQYDLGAVGVREVVPVGRDHLCAVGSIEDRERT